MSCIWIFQKSVLFQYRLNSSISFKHVMNAIFWKLQKFMTKKSFSLLFDWRPRISYILLIYLVLFWTFDSTTQNVRDYSQFNLQSDIKCARVSCGCNSSFVFVAHKFISCDKTLKYLFHHFHSVIDFKIAATY